MDPMLRKEGRNEGVMLLRNVNYIIGTTPKGPRSTPRASSGNFLEKFKAQTQKELHTEKETRGTRSR